MILRDNHTLVIIFFNYYSCLGGILLFTNLGPLCFFTESFEPNIVSGLNAAAGFIQREIAKKLRIRQFPKLQFVLDKGMKEGFKMVQKLNELERESEEIQKQQNEDSSDSDE